MPTRRAALLASAALPFARIAEAQQPSTLRIAMTLADIPVTDGAPDQGTEGIRFTGYTLYDPLPACDLSSATMWPNAISGKVKGYVHPKSWYVDFSPVTVG